MTWLKAIFLAFHLVVACFTGYAFVWMVKHQCWIAAACCLIVFGLVALNSVLVLRSDEP